MDNLIVKPGFLATLLRAVGLVRVDSDGKVEHSAGADYVEDLGFKSGYDPRTALSALAAFPWPYSCVQAISTDLSKVPLRAYRGRGADAEVLDNHPVLDLLEQPSSRVNGTLFRRQLYTDMVLTGNAFTLIAGTAQEPTALLRLHPARVTIAPLSDGQPDKYQYTGGEGNPKMYDHSQVLHVRSPSWSDDPSNLWGTGAVQPLHNDLTTEKHQAELAARTAASGQPTGILSPKEEGDRWSKEQIKTLRQAYEGQMRSGGSGVLILGGQAQFEKLQITPREMEFSQVRDFVRASTIAAFGCVPVRLGLETANYSQSRNQLQLYWESLQGRAALVDSELTRLARLFDDDITLRHDFSEIESLQESRTERLNRVMQWTMLGVPKEDAAAYEGFDDLPVPEELDPIDTPVEDERTEPGETSEPKSTDEPLAATALNGAQISSLMQILESVAMGAISFDSALVLIGVAFPSIDEDSARKILAGAQEPDEGEADRDQLQHYLDTLFPVSADDRIVKAKYDDIDFSVPKGVKAELERGLEWHEQGFSGDGLVPATVSWARRMSQGEPISPEKAVKMRAWLARHESDKTGEGFSPGEDGFPSPGRVAWALWGGDPAVGWSSKLVKQMDAADEESKMVTRSDDQVWKRFIERAQSPAEKKMQLQVLRFLKGYGARIAKRLPSALAKKAVNGGVITKADDEWVDEVMNDYEEGRIMDDAVRTVVTEAYVNAIENAVEDMPMNMSEAFDDMFSHDPIDKAIDKQIGELVTNVTNTTRNRVQKIVSDTLDEGGTIAEMQTLLMRDHSFDASRALAIARTESTRAVNAAGINAWEQMAANLDMEVEFIWKAQPGARTTHAALDGTPRGPDGVWESNGFTAPAPGQFGEGSLDINCRCTYKPQVK